jgi:heavy metal sensor kinase
VRSISARLTLLYAAVFSLILGMFSVSLYLWVREGLEDEADKELTRRSREVLERLGPELAEPGRGLRPEFVQELVHFLESSDCLLEIRRPGQEAIYASPGFSGPRGGYRERTEALAVRGGEPVRVRLAMSQGAYERRLHELVLYFTFFFPIAIAVAVLFGYLFSKRAMAPIEKIRQQAELISRSNLSERIPEPSSTGEVRDLVRTSNEMLSRLEGAMLDLENFAADAAHELRTPLATLRAEIETALEESRPPEEYQRILASVQEEVAKMSRIVTDLFTLAKLDLRQYALQKERVRLGPILEEARETLEPLASSRQIEIQKPSGDAQVLGDPVALRRVFMNLVENAVKYNRDGGRVTLRIDQENGTVRVQIRDTGIGIPAEHVPRLFQRFYRVDKARSRDTGGVGLGLAICKSFVASHEGQIEVESAPGEGTVFTVRLPAC